MKILYGVQGTGNGHISRASAMYNELNAFPDLQITWLLSGRERERGCGAIRNFEWRPGLTFATANGRVDLWQTFRKNSLAKFFHDVSTLDLSGYDLLITDYEPVLAHAARKRGLPTVGIGHQYAFRYDIPMRGA
ncbi:MAG TPA: glycosyltransferase family protein, partial [Candidatus Acidoferrum sp.]|nr:glycosyltransferase family protein [Candidatus Acidoferrum sp.]